MVQLPRDQEGSIDMEKQSSLEQMVININEAFQRANEEFYANRGPPKSTVSMK